MDTYLNLSQAADLLAELTSNPRIKDDTVRIIMLGAEGKIPVYWRNAIGFVTRMSAWYRLASDEESGPLPDTDLLPDWLQIHTAFLSLLELEQQTQCWTFDISDEDCHSLHKRGESLFDDVGARWFRHTVNYENVTIHRDQLFVFDHDLKAYAATLAPDTVVDAPPAPKAVVVDQVQTQNPSWWQTEHDILEWAQAIGEKNHAQNEKGPKKDRFATSNRKISEVIASRIKSIESTKAFPRDDCPGWERVRKVSLTGWKFRPK